MVKGKNDKIYTAFCAGVSITFAVICFYPLLYSLFLSFCTDAEWIASGGKIWYFPTDPTLTAYLKILGSTDIIMRALGMSFLRTLVGTALGITVNILAAYALSRQDLPGKGVFLKIMVFTILFSGGLIPGYKTVEATGLMDSIWALIIPGLFSSWNVLILKQFIEGIPREMEESAEIDGANHLQKLWFIILPMSKAVLSAICMFTMVGHWNNWFDVSLYIKDSRMWTLQYYIMINFNNLSQIDSSKVEIGINGGVTQLTQRMALTIVGFVPILCIYPFFQRFFKDGVYLGAVKG